MQDSPSMSERNEDFLRLKIVRRTSSLWTAAIAL